MTSRLSCIKVEHSANAKYRAQGEFEARIWYEDDNDSEIIEGTLPALAEALYERMVPGAQAQLAQARAALAITETDLAIRLYEEWSEENYAAGWMTIDNPEQAKRAMVSAVRGLSEEHGKPLSQQQQWVVDAYREARAALAVGGAK